MHHLSGEIATGEPIGNHYGIDGRCIRLDSAVQPPVLGLGLLHDVVTRLIGLDGNNLLDEVGHALGATPDLLASVVELLETLCPITDSFITMKSKLQKQQYFLVTV